MVKYIAKDVGKQKIDIGKFTNGKWLMTKTSKFKLNTTDFLKI